jgi:hypothetical protein
MTTPEIISLTLTSVIGYYTIPSDRLTDLKVLVMWCCLIALVGTHTFSLYLLFTNAQPYTLMSVLTLNIAMIGMLVLLGTAYFFKKYLRAHFEAR